MREPQFGQWWASRQVAARGTGTKLLRHSVVGDLTAAAATSDLSSGPPPPARLPRGDCTCWPPGSRRPGCAQHPAEPDSAGPGQPSKCPVVSRFG
ncbi:hypothetical protein ABZS86_29845 [Streptomyces sp. NPDC005355]|uniref:MmyB family transcriptional regulator n=1 Tax=Streptomyces sp. NPDC005355 TaxID=3157038 RepID=UPI0033A3A9FC